MVVGLILTWLFWPPLTAYLFFHGLRTYGWVAAASPILITAMLVGSAYVDPDIPLFLSLLIHGIVASRLVAEAFRAERSSSSGS
ncbi:MAG: hypothetical protein AAFN74_14875 [Myxococcota bacterium]